MKVTIETENSDEIKAIEELLKTLNNLSYKHETDKRDNALEKLSRFRVKLPEGYKFDRNEANER